MLHVVRQRSAANNASLKDAKPLVRGLCVTGVQCNGLHVKMAFEVRGEDHIPDENAIGAQPPSISGGIPRSTQLRRYAFLEGEDYLLVGDRANPITDGAISGPWNL
jgi:hypothetical protein